MIVTSLLFVFLAYLLGSVPFGLLFVKWSGGGDIRDTGSGNIGATNVLRTGKKGLAIATLFADFLKGSLAVYLFSCPLMAKILPTTWHNLGPLLAGGAAILGHVFPLWLRFKGGKGVATALGTLCVLSPLLALGVAGIWITLAKIFRISSLAALGACVSAPFLSYTLEGVNELTFYCLGVALLIVYTHRSNIKKLLNGTESAFKK